MNITASVTKTKMKYLPLALFAAFASQAANVSAVNHGRGPDGAYEIQIVGDDFSGVSSYSLNNPPRIVVDIPNGKSDLVKNITQVNNSVISSVAIVEGDDRVRATINMDKSVPYTLIDKNNKITIAVKDPLKGPLKKSNKQKKAARVAKADVDFIHVNNNEGSHQGKVVIKLPNNSSGVDIERVGTKVIATLRDGSFARQKKLNVTDFGTPVKSIDVYKKKLSISTVTDNYEIVSYQNDKVFSIEFNQPTVAKIRQDELLPGDSRKEYKGEPLSLNFQDIEVRSVLQLIGDFTNTNIVVSGDISGSITLRLNDVPWDQALDIILQTKGLGMQRNGNIMYIAPAEVIVNSLRKGYEISSVTEEMQPLQEQMIKIQYARAENLLNLMQEQRSSDGREGGKGMLSSRGYIAVDARTNTLIVNDVPRNIEKIRRLVAKLDIPVRHVLIDARIVAASNNFAHELGIRWGGNLAFRNDDNLRVGLAGSSERAYDTARVSRVRNGGAGQPLAGDGFGGRLETTDTLRNRLGAVRLGASNPTGVLGLSVLASDFLLDMELSAMEGNGRGEVISSPRVVAQDGNKATIKSGKEIAYTTREGGGTATVKFKPVVLSLDVTPKIAPNNMVDMILNVNKDTVGALTQTLDGVVPSIDTNSVETQVLVDNGETVVLGGVYEQTKRKSISKVPVLGDLPVIGNAFKRTENSINKSELLIFVTPKIVDKRYLSNDKFTELRD